MSQAELDGVYVSREVLKQILDALPRNGFPKCDRTCASRNPAPDEDPRCDCGFEQIREDGAAASAVISKLLR